MSNIFDELILTQIKNLSFCRFYKISRNFFDPDIICQSQCHIVICVEKRNFRGVFMTGVLTQVEINQLLVAINAGYYKEWNGFEN